MERVTRRGLNFLLIVFVILTFLLLTTVVPFFSYVFFGAFAAFLVFPIYAFLAPRMGRYFSAWVVVTGVYAVVFVPIMLLVLSILGDVRAAVETFASGDARFRQYIEGLLVHFLPAGYVAEAAEWLETALRDLAVRTAGAVFSRSLEVLLGVFIFGFVLFYGLLNGVSVVQFARQIIPLRESRTDGLFNQIRLALNAVFYGVIFVAIIQATAGGIVWWISGLPNPFFFGAMMFILSIIPFAGPSFVLIPAGLLRIAQGDVGWGVFLILSGVVFVGSIDNFLRPIMVSKFGKINPALVVVGLAGGIVAFGVVGIVLGPLIFALWVGVARELHYEIGQWKLTAFTALSPEEEERQRREHMEHVQAVAGGTMPPPATLPAALAGEDDEPVRQDEGKGPAS